MQHHNIYLYQEFHSFFELHEFFISFTENSRRGCLRNEKLHTASVWIKIIVNSSDTVPLLYIVSGGVNFSIHIELKLHS